MPCSRNDNVGGSDNYDLGYDYHVAARDDLHTANYNHTRRLDLHTSRHHNYTCSHDYDRRLDYDASRHHHNATCHHHVDARSVSLPKSPTYLRSVAYRRLRRRRRPTMRHDRGARPTDSTIELLVASSVQTRVVRV